MGRKIRDVLNRTYSHPSVPTSCDTNICVGITRVNKCINGKHVIIVRNGKTSYKSGNDRNKTK